MFHKYLWWLYALICCLVFYWLDLQQVFPLCVPQIGNFKAAHRLLLAVATVARAAPYPLPSRGQAANDNWTAENQHSSMLGLLPTALYHFKPLPPLPGSLLWALLHLVSQWAVQLYSIWLCEIESFCSTSPALATHRGQVIARQLQSAMHVFFCCYYSQLTDAKVTFGQFKCGNPFFKPSMSNLDHHISIWFITNPEYLSRPSFLFPLHPIVSSTVSPLYFAWHSRESAFGWFYLLDKQSDYSPMAKKEMMHQTLFSLITYPQLLLNIND